MNALIIGFGSIGEKHLKNLLDQNFFKKIYILSNRNHKKKNNRVIFIKKLLNLENCLIKLIIICSPSSIHLKDLNKCLNYFNDKAYILLEKPISDNFKKCFSFFSKKNIKKNNIFVGYQMQYSQALKKMTKIIESNRSLKILDVEVVCESYLPNWRNNRNFKRGVSLQKAGGGVLLELSHEINYIIKLFGLPKKVYCLSQKDKLFSSPVEENITAKLFYADGKVINLKLNFDNIFEQKRFLKIRYDKEIVTWNLLKNYVEIKRTKKTKKFFFDKDKNLLLLQINFIVNSFINRKNKNNSLNLSLKTLKLIKEMKKSIIQKTVVNIV